MQGLFELLSFQYKICLLICRLYSSSATLTYAWYPALGSLFLTLIYTCYKTGFYIFLNLNAVKSKGHTIEKETWTDQKTTFFNMIFTLVTKSNLFLQPVSGMPLHVKLLLHSCRNLTSVASGVGVSRNEVLVWRKLGFRLFEQWRNLYTASWRTPKW